MNLNNIKTTAFGLAVASTLLSVSSVSANDAGEKIYNTRCVICHAVDTKSAPRLAPPPFAVVDHVKGQYPEKAKFKAFIADYLKAPTKDKATMPGAVSKFGLMPPQMLSDEEVDAVTDYLYELDVELPESYKKHKEENHKKHKGEGKGKH